MHYMQGSNVTTLVFVCVRVATAGCDRATRMHQDGLTLSPASYIHRSPPSASSFSFSSPPFLPFISFPTLCSSFHSCFVLPPPHLFISPLLQYIPSLLFSFSFMSLPSSYLSPLLHTSSTLLSTPLFLLSIIYLPPTPHSLNVCYLIFHLFLFSPYPSPPSSSPCFRPLLCGDIQVLGAAARPEFTSWYISFLQQWRRWWMACCRRRSAAMSYRGDYRQRRLLTGHFITVTGGEGGEKRERERREGEKQKEKWEKHNWRRAQGKAAVACCGRNREQNHQKDKYWCARSHKNKPWKMLGLCTVMWKLESGPTDIVSFLWVRYRAMRVRPCICVYML